MAKTKIIVWVIGILVLLHFAGVIDIVSGIKNISSQSIYFENYFEGGPLLVNKYDTKIVADGIFDSVKLIYSNPSEIPKIDVEYMENTCHASNVAVAETYISKDNISLALFRANSKPVCNITIYPRSDITYVIGPNWITEGTHSFPRVTPINFQGWRPPFGCQLGQNELLMAESFAGGQTIDKNSPSYVAQRYCLEHPPFVTDLQSGGSTADPSILGKILTGQQHIIDTSKTVTLFYVVNIDQANLRGKCAVDEKVYDAKRNECLPLSGVGQICSSGVFDEERRSCITENVPSCKEGGTLINLDGKPSCIINPPIGQPCTPGTTNLTNGKCELIISVETVTGQIPVEQQECPIGWEKAIVRDTFIKCEKPLVESNSTTITSNTVISPAISSSVKTAPISVKPTTSLATTTITTRSSIVEKINDMILLIIIGLLLILIILFTRFPGKSSSAKLKHFLKVNRAGMIIFGLVSLIVAVLSGILGLALISWIIMGILFGMVMDGLWRPLL